ncbi:hypothetical protein DSECCO2_564790 [anaerobic digester metagenome]
MFTQSEYGFIADEGGFYQRSSKEHTEEIKLIFAEPKCLEGTELMNTDKNLTMGE